MSWVEVSLSEICTTITDGAHNSPASQEDGYPMGSVKDMTDLGIDLTSCRKISSEDYAKLFASGCQPYKGDVLIAKDGNSCLQTVCVHKKTIDLVLLSSIAILRPDPEKCDSRFLKYHLANPSTKAALRNYVSGTAIPRVVLRDFKNYRLSIPQLETQKQIGNLLEVYDDLIENNKRRIELLEESARQLYKEWFVRFRFPGHEHVKIIDGVPEGWTPCYVGDLFTLQRGFDLPVRDRIDGNIPVYASTGINGYHNEHKVKGPGLVTGRSGSLGKVIYISKDFWPLNTALWIKEFKQVDVCFALYLLRNLKLENYNGGAAVPTLNRNDVHSIETFLPPQNMLESFSENIKPVFAQIDLLDEQNIKLTKARDLLLPKLMSGAINV